MRDDSKVRINCLKPNPCTPWHASALLLRRAGVEDQLDRNIRPGAERADADIAARELLGDDAHGLFPEAQSAPLFRNRESEDPELRQLRNDVQRDAAVAQMPAVGLWRDFSIAKLAH